MSINNRLENINNMKAKGFLYTGFDIGSGYIDTFYHYNKLELTSFSYYNKKEKVSTFSDIQAYVANENGLLLELILTSLTTKNIGSYFIKKVREQALNGYMGKVIFKYDTPKTISVLYIIEQYKYITMGIEGFDPVVKMFYINGLYLFTPNIYHFNQKNQKIIKEKMIKNYIDANS